MMSSTTRRRPPLTRWLWVCGGASLLLATGCPASTSASKNPTITAKATRSSSGVLEELKVTGKGFTPSGPVHMTVLLAASGSNAAPYVEEDIKADANGKITYDKKPLNCPQPADYGSGSWTTVSARDTTSGIAGAAALTPGRSPDCGS